MRACWSITRRELSALFGSPIAPTFIVIFLVLAGFFHFVASQFLERGEASLTTFFQWLPWLFLFLAPAVGMRMWAEERRSGTLELLLTMPLAPWQAILGKFLAAWMVMAAALALTFPFVITVNILGDPDNGVIVAGYLGSFLMAGAFLALTSLTSALTRNQTVSFLLAAVLGLALVLVGWPPVVGLLSRALGHGAATAIAAIGIMPRFGAIQRGILDSADLIYFGTLIFLGLSGTALALRALRAP